MTRLAGLLSDVHSSGLLPSTAAHASGDIINRADGIPTTRPCSGSVINPDERVRSIVTRPGNAAGYISFSCVLESWLKFTDDLVVLSQQICIK